MIFTAEEKNCFKYILPAQGNIKTLELVESIFSKVQGVEEEIKFDVMEKVLILQSIETLDQNHLIPFQCLPLVRKILGEC
jgi:hypothetical protein